MSVLRVRFGLLIVGLVVLSSGSTVRAQDPTAGSRVAIETDSPVALAAVVKAEFAVGSVASAFAAIERPLGDRLQAVVHASARDVAVPRVTVSHSTVLGVIDLVGKLVPDLRIRIRMGAELRLAREVLDDYLGEPKLFRDNYRSPEETVVVIVDLAEEDDRGKIDRKLRIYRVSTILSSGLSMDDLATAVDTVWQLDPGAHTATLKFHKETGLLVCFGSPRHLALAEEVIERLSGTAVTASAASRMAETEALVRNQLASLASTESGFSSTVGALRQQVAELQRRLADLERAAKLPAPGGTSAPR